MTTQVEEEVQELKIVVPSPNSGWQDEFVRCTAKRQAVKAGRQSGKTFGASIKAVDAFLGTCWKCLGEGCAECDNTGRTGPKRVLYAAPTAEQLGQFWFEVCDALSPGIDAGQFKKDETEHTIEYPGTNIMIKAKTAWNANTLRGGNWDVLILEEFQLMNEDTWTDVGAAMLLLTDGIAIFIFTPPSLKSEGVSKAKDPRHASKLYKKAVEDNTGRWATFHATSMDNPALSKEALKEITGDMSGDSYRREILAEDDEIETSWLVYGKFDDTLCKIKRFPIPDNWPVYTGHDFGEANHAALFVAQVRLPLPPQSPNYLRLGDYVAFAEYVPGAGSSAERHIEKYKDIMGRKDDGGLRLKLEKAVGGNVTTEEETRQLYQKLGWNIKAPDITKVKLQIDRALAIIEQNQFYVFDDLYRLLGQINDCMWVIDTETRKTTNKIRDEAKYHLLACFRYLATILSLKYIPKTGNGAGGYIGGVRVD
uniref:Putative terminase n=1 Tax=viral metagenome TaxID=1070528 RepID=A0A6M3KVD0_9ZZZZ